MPQLGRVGTPRNRNIAWGFVDQGFSSLTNFGLSLLAGRLLGPSGLGSVFLAFSIYLIVLLLQRSLVSEVLLAITSALDRGQRTQTAAFGLTVSLLGASVFTIVILVLGLVVPGRGGSALLLISPWLFVSLVQDYWRSLLFRERRAAAAAANDGVWLLVMTAAVPIGLRLESTWAVMAVWGLGATGGALLGFLQTRLFPSPPRDAWKWWREEAWPFGRWNAAATVVLNVGSNASAFVLAAIVGASALGGFRAVESLFAPLSLIAPAIALPGLPAVARALALGRVHAKAQAIRLSGIAVVAALAFYVVILLGGWRLLPALFGSSFDQYRDLVPAIAVGQIFMAAGVGFPILMKAQLQGSRLLFARLAVAIAALVVLAIASANYGLLGAAWGTAAGSFITTVVLALAALMEPRSTPSDVATADDDPQSNYE